MKDLEEGQGETVGNGEAGGWGWEVGAGPAAW